MLGMSTGTGIAWNSAYDDLFTSAHTMIESLGEDTHISVTGRAPHD